MGAGHGSTPPGVRPIPIIYAVLTCLLDSRHSTQKMANLDVYPIRCRFKLNFSAYTKAKV